MSETPGAPQPDPALKRLDRFVGTWTMEGNLIGWRPNPGADETINLPYDIGGHLVG